METDKPKNKGGRPEGSMNKLAREAREIAARSGKLPHEILLDIARGNVIEQKFYADDGQPITRRLIPDLEQIKDAAKAAAPYFAPKISTVEVIQGVNDDELDRIIALAAAEAGVSLSTGGEEPEDEDEAGGDSSRRDTQPEVRGGGRRRTRVDPSSI